MKEVGAAASQVTSGHRSGLLKGACVSWSPAPVSATRQGFFPAEPLSLLIILFRRNTSVVTAPTAEEIAHADPSPRARLPGPNRRRRGMVSSRVAAEFPLAGKPCPPSPPPISDRLGPRVRREIASGAYVDATREIGTGALEHMLEDFDEWS